MARQTVEKKYEVFLPTSGLQDESTSAFNMSLASLKRIHDELEEANFNSKNENYDGWYKNLLIMFRELSPLLKQDEVDNIAKHYPAIVREVGNFRSVAAMQTVRGAGNKFLYDGNAYYLLNRLEVALRWYAQQKGLLFAIKTPASVAPEI